jgi:hypothetical protein
MGTYPQAADSPHLLPPNFLIIASRARDATLNVRRSADYLRARGADARCPCRMYA